MRRLTCAFVTALLLTALPTAQTPARPQRIISLIPAVTEILFAIGAGPQVVAVSSFDEYPPEVKNLQRVGALLDPDLERILSLRPDLVVVYGSQLDLMKQLERAGIPAYNYRHAALPDVSRTIREVGDRVGHAAEAQALIKKIDAQMTSIRQRVAGRSRPRTMLVVGREIGALRGIYASGGYGFLHDMLEAAGGDDVFADVKRESVQATTELILARKPEVILEIRAGAAEARSYRVRDRRLAHAGVGAGRAQRARAVHRGSADRRPRATDRRRDRVARQGTSS